jgi:hypothetical protein
MTSSSEITIAEVAAMATVGAPVGVTGGGQVGTVLGGLAGVSPVLAGAYLGYLVVRMLIRAGGARVLGAEPQARTAAGKAMTDGSRSCSTRWRAPRGRSTRGQSPPPDPATPPPCQGRRSAILSSTVSASSGGVGRVRPLVQASSLLVLTSM